jgi:hypothetical protein
MLHSRSRRLRGCGRCATHHCPQDGLTFRIRSVSSCGAVHDLASRNSIVAPIGHETMSAGEARDAHLTVQGATSPLFIYKAANAKGLVRSRGTCAFAPLCARAETTSDETMLRLPGPGLEGLAQVACQSQQPGGAGSSTGRRLICSRTQRCKLPVDEQLDGGSTTHTAGTSSLRTSATPQATADAGSLRAAVGRALGK